MDHLIEEKIVNSFFRKDKAERIIFELKSKKRRACIWKFSGDLMNERCCHVISDKVTSADALIRFLLENGAEKTCYVLSIDESIDGMHLDLTDAVNQIYGQGSALLYFDNCEIGYLECEYEHGAVNRYLLTAR